MGLCNQYFAVCQVMNRNSPYTLSSLPVVLSVMYCLLYCSTTIFNIYMNDFPLSSNFFKFIMYADDTTLYSQFDNARIANHDIELEINIELTNINDWLKINKLALNIKKSKYMI